MEVDLCRLCHFVRFAPFNLISKRSLTSQKLRLRSRTRLSACWSHPRWRQQVRLRGRPAQPATNSQQRDPRRHRHSAQLQLRQARVRPRRLLRQQ